MGYACAKFRWNWSRDIGVVGVQSVCRTPQKPTFFTFLAIWVFFRRPIFMKLGVDLRLYISVHHAKFQLPSSNDTFWAQKCCNLRLTTSLHP